VERNLLEKADTFARRQGLKRSEMIAQRLRLLMA
jgi:metal-responsive CopG/Arc/MetJ family transcriptional regulator